MKRNVFGEAAIFLVLALLAQSLRWFFPMLPGPVNLFLIGSLVNALLILAVWRTKQGWPAFFIGMVLPGFAFLQGHLLLLPLVPVVGLGNGIYAYLVGRFWPQRWVWGVPVLKAGILYGGTLGLFGLLQLPAGMRQLLSFMMGFPQIVTGLLGIFLASLVWRRIFSLTT